MIAGTVSSKYVTPETCDSRGESLELSDLGERIGREEALRLREVGYQSTQPVDSLPMNPLPSVGRPKPV